MTRLGFIGLGTMGHGMALNLLVAGNYLTVWNRTPDKAVDLVCDVAADPVELGTTSDIVFVCVSDTPDVEEVVFGENGVMKGLKSGALIVDHSTISPGATKELAARAAEAGVDWLDAPVSGGAEGAENGTLAVMVGGPGKALDRVRPVGAGPQVDRVVIAICEPEPQQHAAGRFLSESVDELLSHEAHRGRTQDDDPLFVQPDDALIRTEIEQLAEMQVVASRRVAATWLGLHRTRHSMV